VSVCVCVCVCVLLCVDVSVCVLHDKFCLSLTKSQSERAGNCWRMRGDYLLCLVFFTCYCWNEVLVTRLLVGNEVTIDQSLCGLFFFFLQPARVARCVGRDRLTLKLCPSRWGGRSTFSLFYCCCCCCSVSPVLLL